MRLVLHLLLHARTAVSSLPFATQNDERAPMAPTVPDVPEDEVSTLFICAVLRHHDRRELVWPVVEACASVG